MSKHYLSFRARYVNKAQTEDLISSLNLQDDDELLIQINNEAGITVAQHCLDNNIPFSMVKPSDKIRAMMKDSVSKYDELVNNGTAVITRSEALKQATNSALITLNENEKPDVIASAMRFLPAGRPVTVMTVGGHIVSKTAGTKTSNLPLPTQAQLDEFNNKLTYKPNVVYNTKGRPSGYKLAAKAQIQTPEMRKANSDAFTTFLNQLPLSKSHWLDLRRRGFSDDEIEKGMYRSKPRTQDEMDVAVNAMIEAGYNPATVVGFGLNADKTAFRTPIPSSDTYFCPAYNQRDGLLEGAQERNMDSILHKEGNTLGKYMWLSASSKAPKFTELSEDGTYDDRLKPNGVSSGQTVAFYGDPNKAEVILVTEGILKSHLSYLALSAHNNKIAILGLPGVNLGEGVIEQWQDVLKDKIVLDCFDTDRLDDPLYHEGEQIAGNENVFDNANLLKATLLELGVKATGTLNWHDFDPESKGLDDFLVNANLRGDTIRLSDKIQVFNVGTDVSDIVPTISAKYGTSQSKKGVPYRRLKKDLDKDAMLNEALADVLVIEPNTELVPLDKSNKALVESEWEKFRKNHPNIKTYNDEETFAQNYPKLAGIETKGPKMGETSVGDVESLQPKNRAKFKLFVKDMNGENQPITIDEIQAARRNGQKLDLVNENDERLAIKPYISKSKGIDDIGVAICKADTNPAILLDDAVTEVNGFKCRTGTICTASYNPQTGMEQRIHTKTHLFRFADSKTSSGMAVVNMDGNLSAGKISPTPAQIAKLEKMGLKNTALTTTKFDSVTTYVAVNGPASLNEYKQDVWHQTRTITDNLLSGKTNEFEFDGKNYKAFINKDLSSGTNVLHIELQEIEPEIGAKKPVKEPTPETPQMTADAAATKEASAAMPE